MKFSMREVLEMALQTEKKGQDYYNSMADRFKEKRELKDLFEKLALQEKKHEYSFEKLLETVVEQEPSGWEEAQNYFRAMVESEFFMGGGKALTAIDNIKTESDALGLAINFEKESILFYTGLKDLVNDKATIDEVIKEETEHVTWLREQLETVKG